MHIVIARQLIDFLKSFEVDSATSSGFVFGGIHNILSRYKISSSGFDHYKITYFIIKFLILDLLLYWLLIKTYNKYKNENISIINDKILFI